MRGRIGGLAAVLILLVALAANVHAATMAYNLDNVVWSDPGPEIINGNAAQVNITVVTSDGKPFTLGNIAGADAINVTAKFTDSLGIHIDVTGDGVEDTFYATETATTGTYTVSINTSAQPGEYTLVLEAIAYNTTTGEVVDSANASVATYIADPYWVTVFADEGEEVSVSNFKLKLESLTDRGALIVLNNQLDTVTPDADGVMVRQVDLDGDGIASDWLFIESTDSGVGALKFYSQSNILYDEIPEKVTVKGETVTRQDWIKNGRSFRQFILWDQSPLSFIKAEDYYIIPSKSISEWTEQWGGRYSGKTTIVKRTTWLGLFSKDEKIFDGNLYSSTSFSRAIGDDVLKLWAKWVGNLARLNSGWEIRQAITKLQYPTDYELKFRNAAVPAELEFRGKWTIPSSEPVNWNLLVTGEETE